LVQRVIIKVLKIKVIETTPIFLVKNPFRKKSFNQKKFLPYFSPKNWGLWNSAFRKRLKCEIWKLGVVDIFDEARFSTTTFFEFDKFLIEKKNSC
jgi:hypothetical protein